MNKARTSAYIPESSNLWHGILRHINYDTLHRLINLNHIPTFQIDARHKCETCVEEKLTRSYFQSVERHTAPLDFIHSDICDLNLYKHEVVIYISLPLLMIAPSIVMCAYSKVRIRR